MGNKLVAFWASLVFNAWLSDVETCLKVAPTSLWREVAPTSSGFGIEAEVTGGFLRRGERIYEVPISYKARSREEGKKITWVDGVEALWILAAHPRSSGGEPRAGRRSLAALVAGLLAAALRLLGGRFGRRPGRHRAARRRPPRATTTTTTEPPPPGGRRPTAEDPLRVLMAGDSLMADLSLAISSTLQDGGNARARLVAAPSIPRDDTTRALWRQQLATYDPEVIVVMIGVWEGMAEDALAQQPLGTLAWERAYRRNLLDPYLRAAHQRGRRGRLDRHAAVARRPPRAGVVVHEPGRAPAVRGVPDLSWVPGDEILANPDGTWDDILPGPQGNPQRVRRLDTTHLCAEGAVRLARPVLNHLERQWDVPLARELAQPQLALGLPRRRSARRRLGATSSRSASSGRRQPKSAAEEVGQGAAELVRAPIALRWWVSAKRASSSTKSWRSMNSAPVSVAMRSARARNSSNWPARSGCRST